MKQSAVFLDKNPDPRARQSSESIRLSMLASRLLNTQMDLRVMMPLEESEIELADADHVGARQRGRRRRMVWHHRHRSSSSQIDCGA